MSRNNAVFLVTRRYMQKNRKRNVLYILGLTLCIALLVCVFIGRDTAIRYIADITAAGSGKWHVAFSNVRKGEYGKISSYPFVERAGISVNEGDTVFSQSGNPERPFLNIRLYNSSMFSMANIHVTEGRLPAKEGEVVISRSALDDGGSIALGDTIEVQTFRRFIHNFSDTDLVFPFLELQIKAGQTVKVGDSFGYFPEGDSFYKECQEIHVPTGYETSLKVVGFMEVPYYENAGQAAYTALAFMPDRSTTEPAGGSLGKVTVSAELTDSALSSGAVSGLRRQLEEEWGDRVIFNDKVLSSFGMSGDSTINKIIVAAQIFFVILIFAATMILISNIFNISYEQRCRYLGMLSSAGATARQKRSSVYYEAFRLLMPSLPLGFFSGLLIVWGGVRILKPITEMMQQGAAMAILSDIPVHLAVRPGAVSLVICCSVGIVLLSALRPAARIGKVGPIESIRGVEEAAGSRGVQDSRRLAHRKKSDIRESGISLLAKGFFRYEKQQQESIVRALAVFFAIIMTVSYAGTGVIQMVDYKLNQSSDEVVGDELKRKWSVVSDGDESADMDQVYSQLKKTAGIRNLIRYDESTPGVFTCTARDLYSREYWNALYQVLKQYGVSKKAFTRDYYEDGFFGTVSVLALDDSEFDKMLKAVGGDSELSGDNRTNHTVEAEKAVPCILCSSGNLSTDSYQIWGKKPSGYKYVEIARMTDKKVGDRIQTTLTGDDGKDHAVSFRIAGIGNMKQVSRWLKINDGQYIRLFVRESLVKWANRRQKQAFSTVISFDAGREAEPVLSQIESAKHLQLVDSGSLESGSFLEMVAKLIRTLMLLFLIFSCLICFLNVYNSVCSLFVVRRRQNAMLRSVGMTRKELGQLTLREFSGLLLEAFLVALPVSAALCLVFKRVIMEAFGRFSIPVPYGMIGLMILATAVAVLCIAQGRCRKEAASDIIEEIKTESI
jgi:putative ABC transport system permease protein